MKKLKLGLLFFVAGMLIATAQQPVVIGKGSYAEYPPLYVSKTDQHPGDQSQKMLHKQLYISDQMKGKPIPTNDWWTDLLTTQYSGNLWAYPLIVNAEEYGIYVEYPHHWTADGREMKSDSHLEVHGKKFAPVSALADNWHDWGVGFIMQDADKELKATVVHGIPFTWLETRNLILQLKYSNGKLYTQAGEVQLPLTTDHLAVQIGEDAYGIYVPAGTTFQMNNDLLEVVFPTNGSGYMSIAALPDRAQLDDFARYAYNVPRNTEVTWNYDEKNARLNTVWTVTTQNLKGETGNTEVLQGFIPHHYKRSTLDFGFTAYEYATPRGKMKIATGNQFTIGYDFNGILPYFGAPEENADLKNPYNRARMVDMIGQYADKGGFGADTYWGGKGLEQMALYMTFAHEMGETALFEKCRKRLRDALVNWLTFTPGEDQFFFARYDTWGALIGYKTSYDSDTFNDHHFHYGYFTFAASLLSLFDVDFKRDYGDMVTLLAKDYANWDKNDSAFPFFRTLDPWAGHSYAGGLGGWNGNGQESSSEAMQGWGGVYMQGVASGNKAMRDAGIFGWVLESRGTAEYWFDRDRENIDYTRYDKPWSSNLTSQGVGWWTWFSGDPVWMHSIQWMPISPALKYLYESPSFAEWDYAQMWQSKEVGGWVTTPNTSGLSNESGLGNVVLSYLQIFNPDSAASVFDRMWDANMPVARNPDTGGISYFLTHSHRTYGEIQWDIHADMPTSTCYYLAEKDQYTYMVYNPEDVEKSCTFYKNGVAVQTFKAPARKLTVYREASSLTDIVIGTPSQVVEPTETVQFTAKPVDQYGASIEGSVTWSVEGNGTITPAGLFTASSQKGEATVKVISGDITRELKLKIDERPHLVSARIEPQISYLEAGKFIPFSISMMDQYQTSYQTGVQWEILKDGKVVQTDSLFNQIAIGEYTVKATADGQSFTSTFKVLPAFPNIALKKPATSSSEENAGTKTVSATDGDPKTRWGSAHRDGEWIYVDLQEPSYISHVSILWEPSYASLYEYYVSDDAKSWEKVTQVNGSGKYETTDIHRTARYIKLLSLQRASTYGTSLYEFEVYGVSPSMDQTAVMGVQITPSGIQLKEGDAVQLQAKAYNGKGEETPAPISWSVDGEGTITEDGLFIPLVYGKLSVTATSGTAKGTASFIVEESLKLASIELSPRTASVITGRSQEFTFKTTDQFGVPFAAESLDYQVVGEGAFFSGGLFTSTQAGNFLLIAGKGAIRDTARITVADVADINLALNKSVMATSYENQGALPVYVNDGDMDTRWSSAFNDNEYIQIDLADNYVINQMKLFWQDSYAASYRVDVSLDEDEWTTVYTNPSSAGKNETLTFASVPARYVRLTCLTRSSVYGSSLWEWEVFGSAIWQDPVPTQIDMASGPLNYYIGENYQLQASIKDQYGLPVVLTEPITYRVSGGGSLDSDNRFTPSSVGNYQLTVSYLGLTQEFNFAVHPEKVLNRMLITPDNYLLKVGESLSLVAQGYDQYNNDFVVIPLWSTDGGTISQEGVFTASTAGIYTVRAAIGQIEATSRIEVKQISADNLALRKPVEATSALSAATNAVDGNNGTRWESAHQDGPEWLIVDLKDAYLLTDVEIVWETASAANYEVQLSTDKEHWVTAATRAGGSGSRTDQFRINAAGQYLRIYCTKRSTQWGYSIIELRAFGTGMKAGDPYRITLIDPINEVKVGEEVDYKASVTDKTGSLVTDCPLVWSVSGGGKIGPDGQFIAESEGNYQLQVSCMSARLEVPLLVGIFLGVDESSQSGVATSVINGRLQILAQQIQHLALYDLSGRKIVTAVTYYDNKVILHTENLKGVFVLLVRSADGVISRKVLLP